MKLSKITIYVFALFVALFGRTEIVLASGYFDWSTRDDRDGKEAGAFAITPFPVDENSNSYNVTNDEGVKTFNLGTKLYVAKTGNDSGNCRSFGAPCFTISYAISQSATGNHTILVREGTYFENNLTPKVGTDDAHRWMIAGYGQERPIIDGGSSTDPIIKSTGQANAYVTLQRLQIQNNKNTCIRLGNLNSKRDGYFSLIDVETFNCVDTLRSPAYGDGHIYYMNADNGWIYHVTSHRGVGHGIKIGDGASDTILEWSNVYECGYWSTMVADHGITNWAVQSGAHPSCLDFPNDSGVEGANNIVRYNVVHDSLFYGVQLRNTSNFSFHHNEIYNTAHWDDVPGVSCAGNGVSTCPQVLLLEYGGCHLSGNAYSNIIRDSTDTEASGIGLNGLCNGKTVNIYNNIIYNNDVSEINLRGYLASPGSARKVGVFNNTLWQNNASAAIEAGSNWAAGEVEIKGNIIHQAGSGSCVNLDADIARDHNLYFYPSGSRGSASGLHDWNGGNSTDPFWNDSAPWGEWSSWKGTVSEFSGAIDAFPSSAAPTNIFSDSFSGVSRPQGSAWDIGAFEFISSEGDTMPPAAPSGLVVN